MKKYTKETIIEKDGSKKEKFVYKTGVEVIIDYEHEKLPVSYEYYEEIEDDEPIYISGLLDTDEKEVLDYDGCYELPDEVKIALNELGYETDYL